MNYIKKLEAKVELATVRQETIQVEITELKRYLTSSKFHQDTTVQVSDVLARLQHVENAAYCDPSPSVIDPLPERGWTVTT